MIDFLSFTIIESPILLRMGVKIPELKKYLSTVIKSLKSLISGNKTCMKIQDEKPRKRKVAEGIAGNLTNILKDSKENGSTKKNTTQEANKRNNNVSSRYLCYFVNIFPWNRLWPFICTN